MIDSYIMEDKFIEDNFIYKNNLKIIFDNKDKILGSLFIALSIVFYFLYH